MEQFKVDNVIEEQFGLLKGVDLIDIDLKALSRKLDAHPIWDIYKLYSYYTQIIKSDLYDVSNTKEEKEIKEKLIDKLKYFEERATYIRENLYIKDSEMIRHEMLNK